MAGGEGGEGEGGEGEGEGGEGGEAENKQNLTQGVRKKGIRKSKIRNLGPQFFKVYRCFFVFPRFSYCFLRFPSPNLKKIQALVKFYRFLIVLLGCILKKK